MRSICVLLLVLMLGCSAADFPLSTEQLQGPMIYDPVYILKIELTRPEYRDTRLKLLVDNVSAQIVDENQELSQLPTLLEKGQLNAALNCINTALKSCDPSTAADLYLWRGAILYSQGAFTYALASIEKSIGYEKENWRGYFHQYYILERLDQDASEARNKVLQLNPEAPLSDYHSKATDGGII